MSSTAIVILPVIFDGEKFILFHLSSIDTFHVKVGVLDVLS